MSVNMSANQFDVFPKIVPADSFTVIRIKEKCPFIKDDAEYEYRYYPMEHFSDIGEYKYQEVRIIKPVDGILEIRQYFKGEQEHILEIQAKDKDGGNAGAVGNAAAVGAAGAMRFYVYSLKEDLFSRKPYKGDLHLHTHHSDGKESPGYVTASCRQIGLDFMAITDHGRYFPSVESQKAFEDADIDLLICRGEELHPINNPVHIINFGGNFSVNEKIKSDEAEYLKQVSEIEKDLAGAGITDEDARYQCASSIWCFDRIREGGGLAIFCHPYWRVGYGYFISDTVISYMHEAQPFDALEIIGGYERQEEESNTLAIARYNEERAKGRNIPIVGVSDAHTCSACNTCNTGNGGTLFGWYYTIAFSSSLSQDEIIGSIKDLYSVAVESVPGESVRAFGPFRLVKYAMYLIREVFPEHDGLCREEGGLMHEYFEGNEKAAVKLAAAKGQIQKLYNRLWAQN